MSVRFTALTLTLAFCAACATPTRTSIAVAVQAAAEPRDEAALIAEWREADSLQVVLAAFALMKAQNADVKRLAETVMHDHMAELSLLEKIAASHAPRLVHASATRGMAPVVEHLKAMPAGAAFDVAFVELVSAAHERQQQQRAKLRATASPMMRDYMEETQPLLEWHLRMAEALRRAFAR
jgi:predicted outer membrane protein